MKYMKKKEDKDGNIEIKMFLCNGCGWPAMDERMNNPKLIYGCENPECKFWKESKYKPED